MKKSLFLIAAMTLAALTVGSCGKKQAENDANKAPEIVGTNIMTGEVVRLSDFRGKAVLVNFWATWCPPCRMEIPDLIKLASVYSNKLQIIGISADQDYRDAVSFYQAMGMNYPVIMISSEMAAAYGGITGIPTSFFIDTNGNIANSAVGYRNFYQFEQYVKPLMQN